MKSLSLFFVFLLMVTHNGLSVASKPIYSSKKTNNSHAQTNDSAPKGPVPVFFKPVKPIDEPLSRYGNPSTYQVDGHQYDVMTSATGYRTQGLASWYGTKFHAGRTSSGETYDMYALTAAHKTLPLPTYIKVKNLDNGRTAIIKVNDRGPFHKGRIIDLSYGAAVKLGLFPKGTAPVEIEALSLKAGNKPKIAQYYLQAGAFRSSVLADTLKSKLAKITPSTVFVEKNKNQYLVKLGPFATKKMTDELNAKLKKEGVGGSFAFLQ